VRTLLTPVDWQAASGCFVCDPANRGGLQVPFYLDDDAGRITAEFWPEPRHAGLPALTHDGVITALLSEAMSWAVIAISRQLAVAHETSFRFERPVRIGQAYTLSAWPELTGGGAAGARAELLDGRRRVCATAQATFHSLDPDSADEPRVAAGSRGG
jgi:acyl-coenzyme A thioesterase PaaI-like protein